MTAAGRDLVTVTTRFCRALRERGILVTPAESIDAVRALEMVDLGDRAEVYLSLRAVLVTRPEDFRAFDELFDRWWSAERPTAQSAAAGGARPRPPAGPPVRPPGAGAPRPPSLFLSRWARDDVEEDGTIPLAAPSTLEAAGAKDFRSYADDELEAVSRVAARIARRLNARPSRRWRMARRGTRLHLRRIARLALKTGGDPVELAYRERKLRRTKLVALLDVSGSMDLYSRFLLQFLYALQHAFARVETFAFSTRLYRITESLEQGSYREALDRLARDVPGWSGGTRIGESVAAFLRDRPRLLDRRTVVIVLSDGWDTGEPAVLEEAMRAIHRRAGRVVWLNPLLGTPTYQPLTRGMQAALPHVDVFASAHNLASLEELGRHLSL